MARKLRLQYPGAIYHVMSSGDRREDIFLDEADRVLFLTTLGEVVKKTGWQIHSYCLMRNHFHLVMETPNPNLVEGMKFLLGVYTNRFNHKHRICGHLFSGRYKALIVDGSGSGYLKTVCDYVHLNPVRAKLIEPAEALERFPWSSYRYYLVAPTNRPAWLRVDRLLGEWCIQSDDAAGRFRFAAAMEARRAGELDQEFKNVRRGWFLGSDSFREKILEDIEQKRRKWHYGQELIESAIEKAERLVTVALAQAGETDSSLALMPKSDPFKIKLATRLREQTTVGLEWIANRLLMGKRTSLAQILFRQRRAGAAIKTVARNKPNRRR